MEILGFRFFFLITGTATLNFKMCKFFKVVFIKSSRVKTNVPEQKRHQNFEIAPNLFNQETRLFFVRVKMSNKVVKAKYPSLSFRKFVPKVKFLH